jgi:hypothetical protein
MTASILGTLKTFVSLCAEKASPNVIIATTMWGNVSREEGAQREEDLNDEVLPKMDGSRTQRFEKTYESAWRIVSSAAVRCQAGSLLGEEIDVIGRGRFGKTKGSTQWLDEIFMKKLRGIFLW